MPLANALCCYAELAPRSRLQRLNNAGIRRGMKCLIRMQRKGEGRPLVWRTLGPNASAMASDDSINDRQSNSGPLELGEVVQTLEWLEKLISVSGIEARPIVANAVNRVAVFRPFIEFDSTMLFLVREFPGVAKEVLQRDSQEPGVSFYMRLNLRDEFHLASRLVLTQFRNDQFGQC
jgi:hypothetical protein